MNQVQGFQAMASSGRALMEDVRPYYELCVEAVEFTEIAQTTLVACERLQGLNVRMIRLMHRLILLQFPHHHWIASRFFTLLANYLYVQLLLSDMGQQKKSLVAAYNFLYTLETRSPLPTFQRYDGEMGLVMRLISVSAWRCTFKLTRNLSRLSRRL